MTYRKRLLIVLALVIILAVFLANTNPSSLPLVFLTIPLLLFALVCYQLAVIFMIFVGFFSDNSNKRQVGALAFSSLATGVLVFQSIGGITAGDIILLAMFGCVSIFYLIKLL